MKAQNVKNTVIVPVGAKGGFVSEAPAGRHARRGAGRGRRLLPDFHPRPARPHRQHRRRQDRAASARSCAATATMPISWSRPTRARRPSPTSPTRSPSNTASGSAMRSPPAARPATTTRRWRITARGAWECVKRHFREIGVDIQKQDFTVRRHRRHVGRRVRQRHAAVAAHPPAGGLRSSPHLHRSRRRMRRRASRSASACSICRARAGTTTTASRSPRGGGVFPRTRQVHRAVAPKRERCSASRRPRPHAQRDHPRDPAACPSTCCGTAASART